MPVKINNSAILPAPIVTFAKTPSFSENGKVIGADYVISLQGQILQNKGNPVASTGSQFSSSFSGAAWTSTQSPHDDPLHGVTSSDLLISTITKIEQLRDVVSPATGIKLEIIGFDHNQGLKLYGDLKDFRVESEGNWAKPASYIIDIGFSNFIESANSGLFSPGSTEDNFGYYVSSASETWGIQEGNYVVDTGNWDNIRRSYNITRSLSAKGKRAYTASGELQLEPWQQASGYVLSQVGLGSTNLPDSILAITSGYVATNYGISETVDKLGGSYSVEETYSYVPSGMLPSGIYAFEECQLDIEKSEGSLVNVNIRGTITGIETNYSSGVANTGVSKFSNALNYYNSISSHLYNRARINAGIPWLHPLPKTTAIGKLPNAGQITYSYSYDNRPPNLINGSISERISIEDTHPGQIISETPVIGRSQAVLGYMNSRTNFKRSLSINVLMDRLVPNWTYANVNSSGVWSAASYTDIMGWFSQKPSLTQTSSFEKIYQAANPANESGVVTTKVFYTEPKESWEPTTGSYSYNISWTYEKQ